MWAGKLKTNESKIRDGQHLNGNLTIPKTKNILKDRGLSHSHPKG